MNLFLEYQKKIINCLKNLDKKRVIQIPSNFNIAVELPPKNHKADISCNAAMVLAKINNKSPINLAEIIKKHLQLNFKEFQNIDIAGPGFLNISFNISFWNDYLTNVIKLNSKYGSNKKKKKYITLNLYPQTLLVLCMLVIVEVLYWEMSFLIY